MALTLQQIITEVDILVPNPFDPATKVTWLNEINTEFFEVVKIPAFLGFAVPSVLYTDPPTNHIPTPITLNSSIRGRNIIKVQAGTSLFPSFAFEDVTPGTNYHVYDDTNFGLSLFFPPPAGTAGAVKYFQIAMTTFVSGTLTAVPDAPAEYHWIYVNGLAAKVAKALPDIALGNNYTGEYQANLAIAQQNYQRSG